MLAEDKRHQSLIRRYLYRAGFGLREIRFTELPSGRGCGEQWVRDHYVREVRAFRARSSKATTALIVAVDADVLDVIERAAQLQFALSNGKLDPRAPGERIAHLIPKRNVETWLLCLTGQTVDELTDYKRRAGLDVLAKPAAETLFEWSRDNAVASRYSIPSLQIAISEVRRLDLNHAA